VYFRPFLKSGVFFFSLFYPLFSGHFSAGDSFFFWSSFLLFLPFLFPHAPFSSRGVLSFFFCGDRRSSYFPSKTLPIPCRLFGKPLRVFFPGGGRLSLLTRSSLALRSPFVGLAFPFPFFFPHGATYGAGRTLFRSFFSVFFPREAFLFPTKTVGISFSLFSFP